MIYHDRIDVSEGTDVNNTSKWKDCDVCHYWYFSDKGFKFHMHICSGCNDLLMMSTKLDDFTNLNIDCANYLALLVELDRLKL